MEKEPWYLLTNIENLVLVDKYWKFRWSYKNLSVENGYWYDV
jgi:hypothetical protein